MTKAEIIEILVDNYREDREELLEEYGDDSVMFSNGRDFDAEDRREIFYENHKYKNIMFKKVNRQLY